ncbi:phosphatidylglycerol lysyltransferase domain-containing protein [Phaeobacter inhibens]|uniref:phosphatidylglycerol lysyltransferase domain-containing protein n=1 Tax=Phaeobacter inhibens TaxID=221822 RepID=UPI0021A80925|nr:phosphatidylglycerol lysyltransferase domain-containing protein [Phaeobacter inhibens]UWR89847.1 phosphatidylglycerol lysyltransferase domain-containing protein [Phaeobacter inhibens]
MPRRPSLAARALTRTATRAARLLLPVAVMLGCLALLQAHVTLPDLAQLRSILGSLAGWQWAGALIATGVSFWALGRYDSVAHRHLGTGLDGPQARRAGIVAIAISQTLGFGLITGAFARWRMLKGLRPLRAAQLTGMVAITFLIALAGICGAALLLSPSPVSSPWLGTAILLGTCAMITVMVGVPVVRIGRMTLRWPSLTAIAALGFWAMIDVVAAGSALWLLLPAGVDLSLAVLLPAYFLALGVAILSSAPGGAGAFELALCAMLPTHATAEIIAAILAFRLVYYLLPAVLAGLCLCWPALTRLALNATNTAPRADDPQVLSGSTMRPASHLPHNRPIAEAAVIRQNGGHIHAFGLNQVALVDSPQASIALFGAVSGHLAEVLPGLRQHARLRNAVACLYKCTARDAAVCRRARWRVLRIAQEAVLHPVKFSESGSSRRQLRRKLRQAEKAEICVLPAAPELPIEQMAQIDSAWQAAHGGAKGTTMGRFQAEYLAKQQVFIAWHRERMVGFVSFHAIAHEWCLDLVRLLPEAPDGTGHALIRAAIAEAAALQVPRLSLAAVPDHRFAKRLDPGLRRFKTCFAPMWEDRYVAAPSILHLTLALGELLRLVHHPAPLPHWSTSAESCLADDNSATDGADSASPESVTQSDANSVSVTEESLWRTFERRAAAARKRRRAATDQRQDGNDDDRPLHHGDPPHNEDEENEIALTRRA